MIRGVENAAEQLLVTVLPKISSLKCTLSRIFQRIYQRHIALNSYAVNHVAGRCLPVVRHVIRTCKPTSVADFRTLGLTVQTVPLHYLTGRPEFQARLP
jgi:hypothetical protein